MDLQSQASGIGALADETRRELYEYVVAADDAVGREEAAAALELPPHRVKFHLDRLVDEGLLEVEYRRLSGRSGPGAGRPSKLYRRSAREFAVTLPGRRYDLVGDILAAAVSRTGQGVPMAEALADCARAEGRSVAAASVASVAPAGLDTTDPLGALAEVLQPLGYEPRVEPDHLRLSNCPFDALAAKHTALVCGLNRDFVDGVTEGLGCPGVRASLEPEEGQCCVKARLLG